MALGLVVVAVMAIAAAFFWSYLDTIKRDVERRDHRILANAVRQLQFRIDGTVAALHQTLIACQARDFAGCVKQRLPEIPGAETTEPSGRYAREYDSRTADTANGSAQLEQEPGMVIFIEGQPDRFQLVVALQHRGPQRSRPVWVRSDLTDTLAAIARQPAFQAVFLTDERYRLHYRSNATSVPIGDLRELVTGEPARLGEAEHGAGPTPTAAPRPTPMRDGVVTAAGDDYTVFVKRTNAEYVLHDAGSGARIDDLVFVGVARGESLVDESRVLPPLLTQTIAVVIAISLLLLPIARLFWIAPFERLMRRDVALIAVGGSLAVALLFYLVADGFLHRQLRRQQARVATALGRDIENALTAHVCDMAGRLRAARDGQLNSVALASTTKFSTDRGAYPFAISLIGTDGRMNRYWEYKPDSSDMLAENHFLAGNNYSDRRYFADVQADNMLRACSKVDGVGDAAFSIEVVQSKLSGQPTVALAMPFDLPKLPAAANALRRRVLTIGTSHMFVAPVVPPGYAYAIVDAAGDVQFHSDVQRAKVENLLAEIDPSDAVAHALRFHVSGAVSGSFRYLGRPVALYLRPLRAFPEWTIVVVEDRQLGRTFRSLAVVNWVADIGLYLVVLAAFAAFVLLVRPPLHRWMAPHPDRAGAYLHTAGLIAVIALTGAATRYTYPGSLLAVGAFFVPLCVLALLLARFAWAPRKNRLTKISLYLLAVALWFFIWIGAWVDEGLWGGSGEYVILAIAVATIWPGSWICREWAVRRPNRLMAVYAGMITVALIVLAGVPSAIFVRSAYSTLMVTTARYGQVELIRQILDRTSEAVQGGASTRAVSAVTPWNWPNFLPTKYYGDRAQSWQLEVCRCGGGDPSQCPGIEECKNAANQDKWYDASLESVTDAVMVTLRWITGLSASDALGIRYALDSCNTMETNGWQANTCGDVVGLCLTDPRWNGIIRGQAGASFAIAAAPFSIDDQPSGLGLFLLLLGGLAVAGATFAMTVAVARRLYVRLERPWLGAEVPAAGAAAVVAPHLFVYQRSGTAKTEAADVTVLDIRECERGDEPAWITGRILPETGTVILDHFDHRLDVGPLNRRRLRLLELLLDRDTTVVVVSATNLADCTPVFHSSEGPFRSARSWTDSAERRRWDRVLSLFVMSKVPLDGTPCDALRIPGLASVLAVHAAARQPSDVQRIAIWSSLTNAEKLLLVQIASEGYANYKSDRVLRALHDRGLISRSPVLGLADDAWRRFTLDRAHAEPVRHWEKELAPRTVDALLVPLGVLVVSVVAVMLVTRQDIAVTLVTALGGLATFISVAAKLLGTGLDRSLVKRATGDTMVT